MSNSLRFDIFVHGVNENNHPICTDCDCGNIVNFFVENKIDFNIADVSASKNNKKMLEMLNGIQTQPLAPQVFFGDDHMADSYAMLLDYDPAHLIELTIPEEN